MSRNAAILEVHKQLDENQYYPFCFSLVNDFVKFKRAFNACGFSDKYLKCQLNMASLNESPASYKDSYFQFYDAQYVLIEIRIILKNYFDYWVLVLGFLANLATAIVKKSMLTERQAFTQIVRIISWRALKKLFLLICS
jgi:hypothetical protein